ncbi:MAG TPA: RNA polymerase sigma factor [Phycisphaerales bacterium]|nr:RNA polymerase sigma factor [Phycisphaerales bacterium]
MAADMRASGILAGGGSFTVAMERDIERRLIARSIAGDREAAAELLRHHQPSLRAYLHRLSGRADIAEDITQEAFVRVLANLHRFDDRFRFSTWLFTIAKRLYVNARQKHAPIFNTEALGWRASGDVGPYSTTQKGESTEHVRDALQVALMQLGEVQREIVVLFHQLDWPIVRIAEHMDMPEGTVKSHLHRSRQKLRRVLSEHVKHGSRMDEVWS